MPRCDEHIARGVGQALLEAPQSEFVVSGGSNCAGRRLPWGARFASTRCGASLYGALGISIFALIGHHSFDGLQ